MVESHDPIALELFKNAIFSIADEMALTIARTAYSSVVKENMDLSTALADADGQIVARINWLAPDKNGRSMARGTYGIWTDIDLERDGKQFSSLRLPYSDTRWPASRWTGCSSASVIRAESSAEIAWAM